MISSRFIPSLWAAIALFGISHPAQGANFYPLSGISTTMVNGSAAFPLANVIEGAGVGFDLAEPHNKLGNNWYTNQAGADYINGRAGAEEIIFDLGADVDLSEISYWGYASTNANGMREFNLKFATEAEGNTGFGMSITGNPSFAAIQNPTPRQSFDFAPVTARYVLLTATSTFYAQAGAGGGGDRLGIGEIAFEDRVVAEEPELTVASDIFLDVSRTVQIFDVPVSNTGGSDLTILGVTFGGANGDAFSVDALQGTIASFSSGIISIEFDPTALIGEDYVPVSATMEIASNDPNTPTIVNLTAEVPAPPSEFYSISSVSSNVANFYVVENLIRGIGVDFDSDAPHNQLLGNTASTAWVTNANGADFFNNVPSPAPVLVFDLGEDKLLSEISVWGYSSGNSNGMSNFSLRFATDADGDTGFGTTVTYNPAFIAPFGFTERNSFEFNLPVSARYVELTPLDNYSGYGFAPGGDRVGIGEVAFEVTPVRDPFIIAPKNVVAGPYPDGSGPQTFSISVANMGMAQNLTISDVVISGDDAANFSLSVNPGTVAFGSNGNLELSFDPMGADGYFQATATITSDDSVTPMVTVSLLAIVEISDPLVAWWPLDADGTDASGNGHDGVLVGNSPGSSAGAIAATAGALDFDGASRFDVPFDPALNPESFTVTLWANPDTSSGPFNSPITSRDNAEGNLTFGYVIYNDNTGNWSFWTGDGDPGWLTLVGPVVTTGSWDHIAITYDSLTNTKILYVNCVEVVRSTGTLPVYEAGRVAGTVPVYSPNTVDNLHIGAGADDGASFYFDGRIDDVALFRTALTPEQLQVICDSGVAGLVNPAQAPFKILSIVRGAEGMVDITFESIPDRIYSIETSIDLEEWTPDVSIVIGESGMAQTTATLPVTSDPFFIHVVDTGQDD